MLKWKTALMLFGARETSNCCLRKNVLLCWEKGKDDELKLGVISHFIHFYEAKERTFLYKVSLNGDAETIPIIVYLWRYCICIRWFNFINWTNFIIFVIHESKASKYFSVYIQSMFINWLNSWKLAYHWRRWFTHSSFRFDSASTCDVTHKQSLIKSTAK